MSPEHSLAAIRHAVPPFLWDMVVAVAYTTFTLLLAAPAWLFFAALERWGPVYGERPSWGAQTKGAVLQIIGTALGAVPVFLLWRWIPHPHPLFPALALPLAILIGDFFLYWEHRVEHWIFWRFHRLHHATRELAGTSNFLHFTHSLMVQLFYSLPVAFLTKDPLAIPAVLTVLGVSSTYLHSPTKLSIGPLRWIITDNRFHRIHHAADKNLHDRNFGAIFIFWDYLFGTLHWAAKDEWPEVGIEDHGEVETVRDFLLLPFRAVRRG